MSKVYEIEGAEISVVSGEFTENKIKGQKYYHAICECNGNTILITKNITDSMEYDIVNDVLSNIYDIPQKHLANVLKNENNLVVMICRHKDEPSFYTIYYGCNETFENMFDAFKWAHFHNDYADDKHMYTEVHDGHQTAIKFEV